MEGTGHEFAALDRRRLGDAAYEAVADALMKGRLPPGERLRIRELAQRMGTSVTPVRDAVLRLVHDGGLVMRSPRDIRVPRLGEAEYLEIRRIRLELEGLAAAATARAADAAAIARLERLVAENEAALAERAFRHAIALNQVFHLELAAIARMPVLAGILGRLWLRMGPVIAAAYEAGGRTMIDHHRLLLDAVRRRDPAAARSAIRRDIEAGGAVILESGVLAAGRPAAPDPSSPRGSS